jgi:hypothetical protein
MVTSPCDWVPVLIAFTREQHQLGATTHFRLDCVDGRIDRTIATAFRSVLFAIDSEHHFRARRGARIGLLRQLMKR